MQLHKSNLGASPSGLLAAAAPLLLMAAQPADACKVLTNAAAAKGAIVLAIRGNCTYTTKVRFPCNAFRALHFHCPSAAS